MAKLYFKYGTMGSSKTAQALMTQFNYEEKGKRVLLLKPAADDRDGVDIIKSRIGIFAQAEIISRGCDLSEYIFNNHVDADNNFDIDVIIVDEVQFLTKSQIEQLRTIVDIYDISVLCFGLKTNFKTELFEGSKRLLEIADSISEIKSICKCGKKAIINARLDENGKINTFGPELLIGDNSIYKSMCYSCWKNNRGE